MQALSINLTSLEDTNRLGRVLAEASTRHHPGALLLFGELGAGKTTLVRMLVQALPGGLEAEVASPSFTICNIYCTTPRVHHFDLYRLDSGCFDEALEESLDDAAVLTVVEWPERLATHALPQDGVVCTLMSCGTTMGFLRQATLIPLGPRGEHCLSLIAPMYPQQRG
jgi:tRNA threonylcarbamoyladenosine biosynthesis protein TsaE